MESNFCVLSQHFDSFAIMYWAGLGAHSMYGQYNVSVEIPFLECSLDRITTVLLPAGEDDKHPIANAGQDMVVQPNEIVTLNGHQSWDDNDITSYEWRLVSGDPSVVMQVRCLCKCW